MKKDVFFITPVAIVENGYNEKFGIPRQSGLSQNVKSKIVFCEAFKDENLIRDIEQYSHLWLIWGFSENGEKWHPTVRPPKLGGNKRVGVFATRSSFRPNPIGLSVVKLEAVEADENGKALVVSGADIMNGTPIFDIKPYLPYVDSIPSAQGGFSEEHKAEQLEIIVSEEIKAVIETEVLEEIKETLSFNPRPAYHYDEERLYGFSYKSFNIKFKYQGEKIEIVKIERES